MAPIFLVLPGGALGHYAGEHDGRATCTGSFPDLIAELITCLREEGEEDLAVCARDIRFYSECGCGDDFCQSFYTAERPSGAYGIGHRCVPLLPEKGYLILDVVDGRIMFVEVLYHDELRRSPGAGAESA